MKRRLVLIMVALCMLVSVFVSCDGTGTPDSVGDPTEPAASENVTEAPDTTEEPTLQIIEITPIPTNIVDPSTSKPETITAAPTAEPTVQPETEIPGPTAVIVVITPIPGSEATVEPTAEPTDAPDATNTPGGDAAETEAPTEDPYDRFYSVMNTRYAFVQEETFDSGTVVCYPVVYNEMCNYIPYVEYVAAEDETDQIYMLEFYGTTYVLSEKPSRILMYWTGSQLKNDGFYYITGLYILVDDAYIIYGENIKTPNLPGRGMEVVFN